MVYDAQIKNSGGGGGGRLLGLRESNQALAEVKTKLEFALSRLNDQDTQRTGIEEIREFLLSLYPDWFPLVISCIGEAGTNLKPLGRCESVKLLGLLAELHGEAVVPLLTRILQVVVTRLQDADLHLREACAETVFRITRALVIDEESSGVFATLLKPLFGALGEHSKWVQIGAAACICSVIQGSPAPVVRDNLGRLCSRLVQHLSLPLAMAKPQLLGACIYAMDAVKGTDFDEVLPSLMPCLESCLNEQKDWQTRKQAIEVLQTIGDNPDLGRSLDLPPSDKSGPTALQRRIALLLEAVRTDKIRAVREGVKDVMLRWGITKAPVLGTSYASTNRSSSPTTSKMWETDGVQRGERPSGVPARSSSPTVAASRQYAPDMERTTRVQGEGLESSQQSSSISGLGGSAGVRNRSTRVGVRERPDPRDEEVTVLVPPERTRASEGVPTAAEKAAAADEKARAIKAALSGAKLQGNQKPKPKRDRQSIFDGPANSNFFTGFGGTPQGASQSVSTFSGMDDLGEDIDASPEESPEASQKYPSQNQIDVIEGDLARDMLRAKRTSPAHDRTTMETGNVAEHPIEALTYSDDEIDALATDTVQHGDLSERSSYSLADVPAVVETGTTNDVKHTPPPRRQRVDQGGPPSTKMQVPKEDVDNGDLSFQESIIARLESLERTCTNQAATIAAQGRQLEFVERQLQLQEQQSRQLEQRIQQHEQQLLQQDKRLHDQEFKIQQQEELCEEQQHMLREHEEQMDKQEQMLNQRNALISDLVATSTSWPNRGPGPGSRMEDTSIRTVPQEGLSRSHLDSWASSHTISGIQIPSETPVGLSDLSTSQRPLMSASLESDTTVGNVIVGATKSSQFRNVSGPLWDKVLELCQEQRYLEAYKQVIAEPEETCLLRLMQHTGPIVERLDAESNSRLIRRLIHILSSPGKEPASLCIEQVFSWLWQALDVGIHFTSSQVEDLAAAIQKASASPSFKEHEEAQKLLTRVSALRRS